jgi:hypothetical protein
MPRTQDRSKPPHETDVRRLPHWAWVAFAVRCAQRVRPLFTHFRPDAPKEHIDALESAITIAWRSARSGSWNPAARSAAKAIARVANIDLNTAAVAYHAASTPAVAANLAAAAAAADAAYLAAAASTFAASTVPVVTDADAYQGSAAADAYRGAAAFSAEAAAKMVEALWGDYENLRAWSHGRVLADRSTGLTREPRWTRSTPVDPDSLGPLWPNGEPEGWPKADANLGQTSQPTVHVEFSIPTGIDRKQADARIADILVHLSDLYRAYGGSGLRIADGHAFQSEPAFVTEPSPENPHPSEHHDEAGASRNEKAGACQ